MRSDAERARAIAWALAPVGRPPTGARSAGASWRLLGLVALVLVLLSWSVRAAYLLTAFGGVWVLG